MGRGSDHLAQGLALPGGVVAVGLGQVVEAPVESDDGDGGVTDMDEANAWLWTAYLPRHNKRLTRKARLNGETAFIPLVDRTARDGILCESHERGE